MQYGHPRDIGTAYRRDLLSFLRGLAALAVVWVFAAAAWAQEADPVLARLNDSPRHHEWVGVKQGERTVHCFVVYPEVSEKATAVLVIHENRGLTDWVRGVADQLAEAGYIAIAPDLLSGAGPDGGKTSDFTDRNGARDALYQLSAEQVTADLKAVGEYVTKLEACNGKLAVAGFCWGGSQTFRFATDRAGLAAAFVFYGGAPDDAEALGRIDCPVYGFYGERDNRITAGVEEIKAKMTAAGKTYEPVVYDGAGHGFMRSGETAGEDDPNRKAMAAAWERWKELLGKL
jgi:carboxymethylenebutenolidase